MVVAMNKKIGIVVTASAVCILLIAAYGAYSYIEKGYAPVYANDVVSNSTTISSEELRAFLKTWNKYLDDEMDQVGYTQISQTTDASAKEANPQTASWLERKGWSPDRFYYVEARLRAIISTIKKDEFIIKNNEMILAQAKNSNDVEVSESLIKYADEQYKKINVEQISPPERAMVTAQFDEIIALLKGIPEAEAAN